MYEADDITEETEEIIVKRAQHSVDRALHFLNRQLHSTETALELALPREEADKQTALTRQRLTADLAQSTLEEKLAKLKVELDKKERAQKVAEKIPPSSGTIWRCSPCGPPLPACCITARLWKAFGAGERACKIN